MKKNYKFLVLSGVTSLATFLSLSSSAQTLGPVQGNFLEINSISGASSNSFYNKRWLVRDAAGPDWQTARLHDGIAIDISYLTPMSNTRTWWERDPYHDIQSWGHGNGTYMTLMGGRLGIGTSNPSAPLSLESPSNGWMMTSKAFTPTAGQINGIKFLGGYPNDTNKWAGIASIAEDTHSNSTGLALYAGETERVRITFAGNVGIGTTDTKGYKLAVAGNMVAESVVVKLQASWPDYVFDKNYEMKSLSEVAAFIKVNKHLPGIPNQKQVEEEGVNLGEMNRKLLEKVEELTLYLLEERNKRTALEDKVGLLEKQVEKLGK